MHRVRRTQSTSLVHAFRTCTICDKPCVGYSLLIVLTLLAALFFGALVVLAHGTVSAVDQLVVFRAVKAGAHLLAALGLLAFSVLALYVVGVVDQSVPR